MERMCFSMNNFKQLFMIILKEKFRYLNPSFMRKNAPSLHPNGKSSKGVVILIVLAVCFLPLLVAVFSLMMLLGKMALESGVLRETISVVVSVIQIAVLIFGMISIINTLYNSTDAQILMSMPIKGQTIFFAKLFYVYCVEFASSIVFIAVTLLPLGISAGLGISYYLGLLVSAFLIPLLPLMIAAILGVPLMFIVSLFKNKGTISTIITCTAFAVIFFLYYVAIYKFMPDQENTADFVKSILDAVTGIGRSFFPNYWLAGFLYASTIGEMLLNLLYVVIFDAGLVCLAYLSSSAVYRRSILKELEGGKSGNNQKGHTELGIVSKQLFSRDMKDISRNTSMGFYCFMQIIMSVVLPVVMVIASGEANAMEPDLKSIFQQYSCFIIGGIAVVAMFFASMNYAATGAFSRENDNIGILKSLPVSAKEIFKSKVKIGIVFNEVSYVALFFTISIVLFMSVGGFNIILLLYILLSFVIASIYGAAFSYFQVYFDLKKPRFHWKSVNEGLKNSYASIASFIAFAVLLVGMGIIITLSVVIAIAVSVLIGQIFMWTLLLGGGILALTLVRKIAMNNAERLFVALDDNV